MLVDGAIDLDDEFACVAVEVSNEAVDDLLAAELEAMEAISAQVLPEALFGLGHALPQPRGLGALLRRASLGSEDAVHGRLPLLTLDNPSPVPSPKREG